jgi:hypothetical protein
MQSINLYFLFFVTVLHFVASRLQNVVFCFSLLSSHASILIYAVYGLIPVIIPLSSALLICRLLRGVCLNVYFLISDIPKNKVTLCSLCEVFL